MHRHAAVLLALLAPFHASLAASTRGEVATRASTAAFDDRSVTGPNVNLTLEGDTWRGHLLGDVIDLQVRDDTLQGTNTHVVLTRNDKTMEAHGLFRGRFVNLVLATKGQTQVGVRQDGGPYFNLTGRAAEPQPPLPQLLFAMLATDSAGVISGAPYIPAQRQGFGGGTLHGRGSRGR